jgi:antitoxin component YwqK of YwqJK toxin-antitoxin module
MRNKWQLMAFKKIKSFCILLCCMIIASACSTEKKQSEHYFLDGYDHLEFRDENGNKVSPSEYIYSSQVNSTQGYFIADSTLTLYNTRSDAPYSGYIRTFDSRRYNLQGEFEDGKMYRLRYWHGNRTLGMDVNYRENTGTLWSDAGAIRVSWNTYEMYYYNSITNQIKQIITDTMTSYFSEEGDLTGYTVTGDSTTTHYYGDGNPRFRFPRGVRGPADGIVKRWHPNGQIQVEGQFKKGEQSGLWIEYDSLGNEINRIEYSD